MTALIQIEHVSKFYYMGGETETIRALGDITLDIVQGEYVAIMRPSVGIGRSVLDSKVSICCRD